MKRVEVKIPGRPYPVLVGRDTWPRALQALGEPGRAYVLADAKVTTEARRLVSRLKRAGWEVRLRSERASEAFKSWKRVYPVYSDLIDLKADRKSVLFAVGGGVIGDAGAFIAGTYLRGIRWISVPTTLLAQVDSGIGGKAAVNHDRGKNLIGVFHQPAAVVCDPGFFKTLPERELVSGLGEMIKYGLTFDSALYASFEKDWKGTLQGARLESAIARCAALKAKAVAADEFDRKGVREVLNFGHTVGHALEGATDYKVFRHGEAIILGMRAAARISELQGHLDPAVCVRIDAFLRKLPVPALRSRIETKTLLEFIRRDKKAEAGRVRFVLLTRIGRTVLDRSVPDAHVIRAIEELR